MPLKKIPFIVKVPLPPPPPPMSSQELKLVDKNNFLLHVIGEIQPISGIFCLQSRSSYV